jgi:hypothetical protein
MQLDYVSHESGNNVREATGHHHLSHTRTEAVVLARVWSKPSLLLNNVNITAPDGRFRDFMYPRKNPIYSTRAAELSERVEEFRRLSSLQMADNYYFMHLISCGLRTLFATNIVFIQCQTSGVL